MEKKEKRHRILSFSLGSPSVTFKVDSLLYFTQTQGVQPLVNHLDKTESLLMTQTLYRKLARLISELLIGHKKKTQINPTS